MRCSTIECTYIAAQVIHTILCEYFKATPSPPVSILRPRELLHQLFQVFPL